MSHVLARLNGYGVQLVPFWPYRFVRADAAGSDRVLVVRVMPEGEYGAHVDPANPVAVEGIVDVGREPSPDGWRIETSAFSACWPDGFEVVSPTDEADSMPYDLVGPDDSLIFPNGLVPKERFSNAQALLAEGQRIIDQRVVDGIRVVELEYTNAGEPWWQSHWLVSWGDSRLLLITAQAPLVHAAVTAKAAELVAGSAWPTGVPLPQ